MDKISKILKRLTQEEKKAVKSILLALQCNKTIGLDIKKLKGYSDIFRVRKGKIRVIFQRNDKNEIKILAIERRSEKTYKNLNK